MLEHKNKKLSSKNIQAKFTVIGNKIQEKRKLENKTLDWLANKTGFTKGYLSKIENGNKIPPLGSLYRISKALDLDISKLFKDSHEQKISSADNYKKHYSIVKKNERPAVIRGATTFGYNYNGLAGFSNHSTMQPFLFTFPKMIKKNIFFEHEGEEFIFILKGKVEWHIGYEKFILNPGDSLYLDSKIPHKGRAINGDATALVVVSDIYREI